MRAVLADLGSGSRTLGYFLGTMVLTLAVAVAVTSVAPADIAAWAERMFGPTFIVMLSALVFVALFCWVKLAQVQYQPHRRRLWLEAGLHAANGVATLALTYTLLGISLGIGSLAGKELSPATIQGVISGLTEHFSRAFLTTVVGLPASAALRALLAVTDRRLDASAAERIADFEGDKS